MEVQWSCYGGGQFKGGRIVTEVASLKEGEWTNYRGSQFNRGENGHVTEVVSLLEGEWSCYRGSHFNGGRMVMLWR